jgi:hypothetical protein
MELTLHLWQAVATGPIEVEVICHPPLAVGDEMDRKAIARIAEGEVREGLVRALHQPAKIG